MELKILLIGADPYFRSVIAPELRGEGCDVRTVGTVDLALETLLKTDFNVAVVAYPSLEFKAPELVDMIGVLRPDLPVAIYTEERDFVELSERFEGQPILDAQLPIDTLCVHLSRIARGEDAPLRANVQSRLERMLDRKAKAEQCEALGAALRRQYDSVLSAPLPLALHAKLHQLMDK